MLQNRKGKDSIIFPAIILVPIPPTPATFWLAGFPLRVAPSNRLLKNIDDVRV